MLKHIKIFALLVLATMMLVACTNETSESTKNNDKNNVEKTTESKENEEKTDKESEVIEETDKVVEKVNLLEYFPIEKGYAFELSDENGDFKQSFEVLYEQNNQFVVLETIKRDNYNNEFIRVYTKDENSITLNYTIEKFNSDYNKVKHLVVEQFEYQKLLVEEPNSKLPIAKKDMEVSKEENFGTILSKDVSININGKEYNAVEVTLKETRDTYYFTKEKGIVRAVHTTTDKEKEKFDKDEIILDLVEQDESEEKDIAEEE